MGYRGQVSNGKGWGLHGDKTSTGAVCFATKSDYSDCGKWVLQVGDQTTPCPKCGKVGVIATGDNTFTGMGANPLAHDGSIITCGCLVEVTFSSLRQGCGLETERIQKKLHGKHG